MDTQEEEYTYYNMNEHELYEDRQKKIAEYPELLLVISY
jgi:hypothetical protein